MEEGQFSRRLGLPSLQLHEVDPSRQSQAAGIPPIPSALIAAGISRSFIEQSKEAAAYVIKAELNSDTRTTDRVGQHDYLRIPIFIGALQRRRQGRCGRYEHGDTSGRRVATILKAQ